MFRYCNFLISSALTVLVWVLLYVLLHVCFKTCGRTIKFPSFVGLFTADQKLKGVSSIYTRQNPNGGQSGYECPEERDYYPYWHPTDWIDIAVLAHNQSICRYYQKESFNVKTKGINLTIKAMTGRGK